MKNSILTALSVLTAMLTEVAVSGSPALPGEATSVDSKNSQSGQPVRDARFDATALRLLSRQEADGEFPGWMSFHEQPGTKTGDVWHLQPDGVLVCQGTPRGYLYTAQSYSNFVLQFEWRYPKGATNSNGGALVRMTGDHAIWPKSLEFQLNMGQAGDFWAIRGYEVAGPAGRVETITNSPYGILHHLPRLADLEKPVGQWNQFEGIVRGDTVVQKVNGTKANEATGCEPAPGKILLTSEGQEIHFRNLKLIVLP